MKGQSTNGSTKRERVREKSTEWSQKKDDSVIDRERERCYHTERLKVNKKSGPHQTGTITRTKYLTKSL